MKKYKKCQHCSKARWGSAQKTGKTMQFICSVCQMLTLFFPKPKRFKRLIVYGQAVCFN